MSDYQDLEENNQLTNNKPKYTGLGKQPAALRFNRKVYLLLFVAACVIAAIVAGVVSSRDSSDNGGNTDPAVWENIRLPASVVPTDYDLFLHPNLTTFDYTGKVVISVKVVNPTDLILLHSSGLTITNTQVLNTQAQPLAIAKTFHYDINEFFVINLANTAAVGSYSISITFNGTLREDLFGFYRSSYVNSQNKTVWLATTQFEPVDARRAFPCFDEPALKATFTLTMIKDKSMVALGNMPVKTTTPYGNNLEQVSFEKSVIMSTYLVAFVVCDFVNVTSTTTSGRTTVSVWTPPDKIDQAQVAIKVSAGILEFYETFFNVSYPLPKQDLIAIPDFNAGAMENWGLITYRETALLVDERASSAADIQRAVTVIAHELAHQWFGNLVTMKWWNDLWLNEGFASFVEYIGTNHANSTWDMDTQFLILAQDIALSLDSLESSHPIEFSVNNPNEINQLFDSISYDKGGSVIRMLYHMMGPENFLKGINSYLKTYEYGNAETAQLWESLNQFSQDNDISAIMNTWTAQVGYPVITFTKNYDTNTTQITQTRFLTIPPVVPDQTLWQVPITLANSNNFSQVDTFIFPIRTVNVEHKLGANEWYLANINRYGFYRVNYDATNWARITNALLQTPTAISASDRAGILNDAFAFSQSGLVELTFPLDLARFLVGETDYTVWSEGISGINFFGTQLRWQPSYGAFQDYFSTLVVPTAQAVGWEVNIDQDAHTTRLLRSLILNAAAVYCGDADAVANATALFQAYMKSGVAVSSDLRDVVYVVGIMYGGREEWEFLWGNYQKTNLATEQRRILRALAATPIPWLLNRLLSYALDPTKIKSQDSITAISYVASRTPGESVAWAFVRNNWDSLVEMLGGGSFSLGNLVEAVVSRFQTQQLYDEVKLFFSQKELGSAALSVEQSLESIKANIEWLAANQAKIEQFLGYSDVAAA